VVGVPVAEVVAVGKEVWVAVGADVAVRDGVAVEAGGATVPPHPDTTRATLRATLTIHRCAMPHLPQGPTVRSTESA
jgi:hypothetical protein